MYTQEENRREENYDKYVSLLVVLIVAIGVIGLAIWAYRTPGNGSFATQGEQFVGVGGPTATSTRTQREQGKLAEPIEDPIPRVTLEPFGVYVTPDDFPLNKGDFEGYHTGVDFEILPGESSGAVAVYAICDGPIVERRTATGYGGVIVQSCTLDNEPITVIYGHVQLSSVRAERGEEISAGAFLAYLGEAGTAETGGERKHLHLGIHRGREVKITGYVSNQAELENWLDPMEYFR